MHIIALNGSPRKKWNTASLLEHALEGARSAGATTKLVHLYDLDYKGCISCFACKKIGGKSYGRCAVKDALTPLLTEITEQADGVIVGSPVYFGAETGAMRSCLERLLFPHVTYTPGYAAIFPRKIPSALIYTMNVSEDKLSVLNYDANFERLRGTMARVFGSCDLLAVTDTYQFDDYAKYLSTVWDAAAKAQRRETIFPEDCAKAFEIGRNMASQEG